MDTEPESPTVVSLSSVSPPQVTFTSTDATERDADFLALRLLNKRARIRLSSGPVNLDEAPGKAALFSVGNSMGWFAAAVWTDEGTSLILSPLADLRDALSSAPSGEEHPLFTPRRRLSLEGKTPVFVSFACKDTRVLVALADGSIALFDVDALRTTGDQSSGPIHVFSHSSNAKILSLVPNPEDLPNLVAVLRGNADSPQAVEILDVRQSRLVTVLQSGQSPETSPSALSWSPKGKLLAVGLQSGDIVTYNPEASPVLRNVFPKPEATGSLSAIFISWLTNSSFLVIYAARGALAPDADQHHYIVTLDSKTNAATNVKLASPYLPFPGLRPPGPFPVTFKNWEPAQFLIFLGDSTSSDIGAIARINAESDESWHNLSLEETSTPSLPLDQEMNDTILIGLDVDLTGTSPYNYTTASGEPVELPASPVMFAYASDGSLLGWHVLNVGGKVYPGMVSSEAKTALDATDMQMDMQGMSMQPLEQMDNQATPPSPPPEAIPVKPSAIPRPVQAPTSGFGFGQTLSKDSPFANPPQTPPTSAFALSSAPTQAAGSATSSGFGKSSFGTPSFGASPFGTSAFGKPSASSSPFGSQPASSTPPASSSSFGGFASFAGKGAFGSSTPASTGSFTDMLRSKEGESNADTSNVTADEEKSDMDSDMQATVQPSQQPTTASTPSSAPSLASKPDESATPTLSLGPGIGFGKALNKDSPFSNPSKPISTSAFALSGDTPSSSATASSSGDTIKPSATTSAFGASSFGTSSFGASSFGKPSQGSVFGGQSASTTHKPSVSSGGFSAFSASGGSPFGAPAFGASSFGKTQGSPFASQAVPAAPKPSEPPSGGFAAFSGGSTFSATPASTGKSFSDLLRSDDASTPRDTKAETKATVETSKDAKSSFAFGSSSSNKSVFGSQATFPSAFSRPSGSASSAFSGSEAPVSTTKATAPKEGSQPPDSGDEQGSIEDGELDSEDEDSEDGEASEDDEAEYDEDEDGLLSPELESQIEQSSAKATPALASGFGFGGSISTNSPFLNPTKTTPTSAFANAPTTKVNEAPSQPAFGSSSFGQPSLGSGLSKSSLGASSLSTPSGPTAPPTGGFAAFSGANTLTAASKPETKSFRDLLRTKGSDQKDTEKGKSPETSSLQPAGGDFTAGTSADSKSIANDQKPPAKPVQPPSSLPATPSSLTDSFGGLFSGKPSTEGSERKATSAPTHPSPALTPAPRSFTASPATPSPLSKQLDVGASTQDTGPVASGTTAQPFSAFTPLAKRTSASPAPAASSPLSNPSNMHLPNGDNNIGTVSSSKATGSSNLFGKPATLPSQEGSAWSKPFSGALPATPSQTPLLQSSKPEHSMSTPEAQVETGMQAECTLLFVTLGKDLESLRELAGRASRETQELSKHSPHLSTLQDLTGPQKLLVGDALKCGQLLNGIQADVRQLEEQLTSMRRSLRGLESSMLKAGTRKEEIIRFNKAKSDKEFAKMLKARTLGPEHLETQAQLRREIRAIRDRVQKLEDHLRLSKKRLGEVKTGRPSLKAPSIDTMNRAFRNIDTAINQQTANVNDLRDRLNRLAITDKTRESGLSKLPSREDTVATSRIAVTTAAALNVERSAQRLKRALLSARSEPLLNTQASSSEPMFPPTPEKTVKTEFSTPPPFMPIPFAFPGTQPEFSSPPSPSFSSSDGASPTRHRTGSGVKYHQKPIPIKKGPSPSQSMSAPSFDWGPLPTVAPMRMLSADVRHKES